MYCTNPTLFVMVKWSEEFWINYKTIRKDFKKYSCAGLLYVTVVYELQFMDILNSIFGADQDTSNKTRGKTKGDKKKVKAAGMYINCLF